MDDFTLQKIRDQGFFEVPLHPYAEPQGKPAYLYISAYTDMSTVTIISAYIAYDPDGQWECTAYYTSDGKKWFEATDGNPANEITEDIWACNSFIYDLDRGYLADGKPICPEGWT